MPRRGIQCVELIVSRQVRPEGFDPEVDRPVRRRVVLQPVPGIGERGPVDRVVVALLGLLLCDHEHGAGGNVPPGPVQAAHPLPQGVEAGALAHEAVEVQVGADLQGLRGDDDYRPVEPTVAC